jgi:prevent-host-death family protein
MDRVSIRELRNNGREVIDRVMAGESLIVTRSGRPIAEIRPLRRRGLNAETLLREWRNVPAGDPDQLRADLDEIFDPSL